jgi:4-hydroxy-2-oxoglutarate aldolase
VPVLLYNFTAATGVNLQPEVVARLADHPNVCGIKESGSDIAQISDLVAVASPRFAVLAGSATTFQAALATGVTGGILALAGLLPEPCVRLFDLMRGGQHDEARVLQRQLLPLARLLSSAWGVAGLKGALALRGVDVGVPRAPLVPAPPQALDALRQALASFEEAYA